MKKLKPLVVNTLSKLTESHKIKKTKNQEEYSKDNYLKIVINNMPNCKQLLTNFTVNEKKLECIGISSSLNFFNLL